MLLSFSLIRETLNIDSVLHSGSAMLSRKEREIVRTPKWSGRLSTSQRNRLCTLSTHVMHCFLLNWQTLGSNKVYLIPKLALSLFDFLPFFFFFLLFFSLSPSYFHLSLLNWILVSQFAEFIPNGLVIFHFTLKPSHYHWILMIALQHALSSKVWRRRYRIKTQSS